MLIPTLTIVVNVRLPELRLGTDSRYSLVFTKFVDFSNRIKGGIFHSNTFRTAKRSRHILHRCSYIQSRQCHFLFETMLGITATFKRRRHSSERCTLKQQKRAGTYRAREGTCRRKIFSYANEVASRGNKILSRYHKIARDKNCARDNKISARPFAGSVGTSPTSRKLQHCHRKT